MSQGKIYTVTEITREIKRVINSSFGTLWIEGEISGYKQYGSGHHYFTLKDAGAQIPCAMWKFYAEQINFRPQDGMKVQAWGNLEVYEPGGRYQFIASVLRPSGIGELQMAFEALVRKLRAEGLFDLEHKKSLPLFPEVVGLVTSRDGAALHDMCTVAARRWPAATLILAPVRVQGAGAAEEIAAALEAFNREGKADVLVVGRGGGSLEDLWAFNEEIVARAIYLSRIPVVSAVGHEVDVTIADHVADVRAPTPSAAMEIVLPDREEVIADIAELRRRLNSRIAEQLRFLKSRVGMLADHWALRQPVHLVHLAGQHLDELQARLTAAFSRILSDKSVGLRRVRELLNLFRPEAVLQRGFAIAQDAEGRIVRDASGLVPGSLLRVTFAKGRVETEVKSILKGANNP